MIDNYFTMMKKTSQFEVGAKVRVKDKSMKKTARGRVIGIYDHFYLVQHLHYKECYNRVDLVCGMVQIERVKGKDKI